MGRPLQESLYADADHDEPNKVTEITVTFLHSLYAEACFVVGGATWTGEQSGLGA